MTIRKRWYEFLEREGVKLFPWQARIADCFLNSYEKERQLFGPVPKGAGKSFLTDLFNKFEEQGGFDGRTD